MDIIIILLIVNVITAVSVIGLTLIQQPKGDMGSAFGGGGSQSMFGSRGSANFLTKSTSWMCFLFFASSLMLAYLYAQNSSGDGVVDQSVIEELSEAPSEIPSIVESIEATDTQVDGLPEIPVDSNATEAASDAIESVENAAGDAIEDATTVVDEALNQ